MQSEHAVEFLREKVELMHGLHSVSPPGPNVPACGHVKSLCWIFKYYPLQLGSKTQ